MRFSIGEQKQTVNLGDVPPGHVVMDDDGDYSIRLHGNRGGVWVAFEGQALRWSASTQVYDLGPAVIGVEE